MCTIQMTREKGFGVLILFQAFSGSALGGKFWGVEFPPFQIIYCSVPSDEVYCGVAASRR